VNDVLVWLVRAMFVFGVAMFVFGVGYVTGYWARGVRIRRWLK